MPNHKYNKNRDGDGRNHNGRPSLIEPFDEKNHNYVVGGSSAADELHRHNTYHPDSPSSFSQLTTATRTRGGDIDADYPAGEIIMIRVIAPATLQEGYEFDVLVDEEPYTVRVPRGGIQEGEVFETEYDPKQVYNYGTTATTTADYDQQQPQRSSNTTRMEQLVEEEEDEGTTTTITEQQQQQQRTSYQGSNSDNSFGGRSSRNSSHRYQQQQQQQHQKKMTTLSSARLYDDVSVYTENDNEDIPSSYLEKADTYPAQSLSGDDDDNGKYKKNEQVVVIEGGGNDDNTNANNGTNNSKNKNHNKNDSVIWYDDNGTPIGGWRTRLYSCCDVLTQSTFWMGFFCPCIQIAQLITRLNLTWNGQEGAPELTSLSYNRLILALIFTMATLIVPVMGGLCLMVYYVVVVVSIGSHVRRYMRHKYKIPATLPTRYGDRIDDYCMMLCCSCCSSIQMARHTHDDKEYPGHGCTTTGLEFDAPEIV